MIASIAIPGAGLWLGYIQKEKEVIVANAQKDKEVQKSYVELGIRVLSDPPNPESEPLREYAVTLINAHSDVKLGGAAKSAIVNKVALTGISASLPSKQAANGILYNEDFSVSVTSDGPGGSIEEDPVWLPQTSLKHSNGRSVDSRKIPYVAVPRLNLGGDKVKLGDYAVVFDTFDGRQSFAVVGDVAPERKALDVSMALANALGIQFDLKKNRISTSNRIICLVFAGSGNGHCPESAGAIYQHAVRSFEKWLRESFPLSRSPVFQSDWANDAASNNHMNPFNPQTYRDYSNQADCGSG